MRIAAFALTILSGGLLATGREQRGNRGALPISHPLLVRSGARYVVGIRGEIAGSPEAVFRSGRPTL